MESLLFLAHRIPYPPNKGDKIRSFNMLEYLASRYRIYFGGFVDDPRDWDYADEVRRRCAETCLRPLSPRIARLKSLGALFTGAPLSLPYFFDRRLHRWTRRVLRQQRVTRVLAFSSPMAQYLMGHPRLESVRSVLDFVDVDSDKWRQYSESKGWPWSGLYRRESKALLRFERRAARAFDVSIFVSRSEAELFRRLAQDSARRVTYVENGVDTEFFSPERTYPDPYDGCPTVFVFTGALDYWANVDAVRWFANQVFGRLRERIPTARFCAVGSRPSEDLLRLGRLPGVAVIGDVKDVRPYVAHAKVSVAPLRIARGVQNKVLEAMSMAKPVLASPQAMDGLEFPGSYPLVAGEPEEWLALADELVATDRHGGLGQSLRSWVLEHHDWDGKLERLRSLLE
jgi:sugar transferase (PEP-CTERM/EpsH1 system associated)